MAALFYCALLLSCSFVTCRRSSTQQARVRIRSDVSISCTDLSHTKLPKTYIDSGFQADVFSLGEEHVVKVAKTDAKTHKDQFDKECNVLKRLEQVPHVIRCVAVCNYSGKPALILSRAHGKAFKKSAITGSDRFEKKAVKTMLETGLSILDQQVVNTDQQPNILFDVDGTATFIDFGAAVLLDGISEGFQDFYVPTYLRELFFLIPNSQLDYAANILQSINCRFHAKVMNVFHQTRSKRIGSEPHEMRKQEVNRKIEDSLPSDDPAEIVRVHNEAMQCPSQPCRGVPLGTIIECLSGQSFDLVYTRCCAADDAVLGSKLEALRKTCVASESEGAPRTGDKLIPKRQSVAPPSQQPDLKLKQTTIIRVNNDAMQCPAEPCRGVPTGKIVECLSGKTFDLVYARCCEGVGSLGSKSLAESNTCS
eukprot:TRINITY_DN26089_c0_g1_i2.p1 TRINITY_DN26089_c0_g1~~TRINITY_DN26089_c0_g1_i2.p1  ORF type:complete len:441 (-),score=60.99 TRINITY_DN26089_c0_g1_i2:31-1299(-)